MLSLLKMAVTREIKEEKSSGKVKRRDGREEKELLKVNLRLMNQLLKVLNGHRKL